MAQSITVAPNLSAAGALRALAAPFRAAGGLMIRIAENSPRMRALQRLAETSDEALAARGLTREGEAMRIIGAMYY